MILRRCSCTCRRLRREPVWVLVDHPQRLAERDVRQRYRRRHQQELCSRTLVHQQRRHHQRRGIRRLRALLRCQQEDLSDHPLAGGRIKRSVQRTDDLPEPVCAGFRQRRRSDNIWQPQLVKDRYGSIRPEASLRFGRSGRSDRPVRMRSRQSGTASDHASMSVDQLAPLVAVAGGQGIALGCLLLAEWPLTRTTSARTPTSQHELSARRSRLTGLRASACKPW